MAVSLLVSYLMLVPAVSLFSRIVRYMTVPLFSRIVYSLLVFAVSPVVAVS